MGSNMSPLVQALVQAFLFLETSDEDQVDPDAAVGCMENMSASLLSLPEAGQLEVRDEMKKLAEDSKDLAYKTFVAGLPNMIGLKNRM